MVHLGSIPRSGFNLIGQRPEKENVMSEIEKTILAVMIVSELLKAKKKILAIKIIRFMYGAGLINAKRLVDSLERDYIKLI